MKINIRLLIIIFLTVFKIYDGYKKGMVKEIVSLVSLCILCTMVALIAGGLSSYRDGKVFNVIITIILLALLGIVHHMFGIASFTAKLISKLPIIHRADKLMGVIFGAFEVLLFLWTLYTFIMMMDLGAIGQVVLTCSEESEILSAIYRYNLLARLIEQILAKFTFVPLV